jgi:3-dehydroquinate synthetase
LRVTRDAPAKIYLDNGVLLRNLPGGVAGDLAGFDAAAADSLAAM